MPSTINLQAPELQSMDLEPEKAPSHPAGIAQAMIDNGFRVVPLKPRTKTPDGTDWVNKNFCADEFGPRSGIGLKTGQGIIAIDIDCYGSDVVEAIVAEFERRFGPTCRRTGQAPKTALLARCDVQKKITEKLAPSGAAPLNEEGEPKTEQLEILAQGQQLVIHGIHPATSKPYKWHGTEPWEKGHKAEHSLPSLTCAELTDFVVWVKSQYGFVQPISLSQPTQSTVVTAKSAQLAGANPLALGLSAFPERSRSLEEVREILSYITTPEGYDEWWRVFVGIKSLGEEYYQIADDWSAKGGGYDPVQNRKLWDSAKKDGGITFKSVAAQAGANGADLSAIAKKYIGGFPSTMAAVQKFNLHMAQGIDANDGETDAPEAEWVAEMNEKYAWVEAQKTFYRFEHEDFIREPELVTHFKNCPLIEIGAGGLPKKSCRVRAWISHPQRAQYHGLAFAPGEAPITAKNEINTFKGFAVAPIAGDVKPYVALRDHLFPVLDERRYIEQWLAHKLKHPGTKMNTALVIWSSAQGVGKNLFFETFGEIIGPKHSCVIEQKDLVSDFNTWAKNKLFVIGDEVLSSGDRKEADRFKGLITGTTMTINEKNQPQYTIGNFASFVFLSNHDDAVHLDEQNRRYFVAEIKAAPLPPQFYTDYAKWRDGGGLAALHHYLVNDVDLAGFDPKTPAPLTLAKEAMISAGRSGLEQWVADAMGDPYSAFGGAVITAEMLKAQYENAMAERSSPKAVVNAAKKAGARVRDGQIRTKDKKKVRVISLTNHDKWATTVEAEWATELERVRQYLLTDN